METCSVCGYPTADPTGQCPFCQAKNDIKIYHIKSGVHLQKEIPFVEKLVRRIPSGRCHGDPVYNDRSIKYRIARTRREYHRDRPCPVPAIKNHYPARDPNKNFFVVEPNPFLFGWYIMSDTTTTSSATWYPLPSQFFCQAGPDGTRIKNMESIYNVYSIFPEKIFLGMIPDATVLYAVR